MPELATPLTPRAFLRGHAPFEGLSEAALDALEAALEIRYAAAGDLLLSRGGAPADALWVVRKGQVELARGEEVLETLGPGECFGYPSLLGGRSPLRDARVVEDALLYRLPAPAFRQLLDEPGAARFFLDGLADRLRGLGSPASSSVAAPSEGRLASLASRRLVTIEPTASVAEAARRMQERGVGSILVSSEPPDPEHGLPSAALLGIVTDRDLRDRVLAAGRGPELPVTEAASAPVATLELAASSLDALLAMSAGGVRHLPLTEGERIVAVISAGDLARRASHHPFALLRRLERQPLTELLPSYAAQLRATVGALVHGGTEALHVGPLVAALNDALTRRLLAESRSGLEELPPFAWVVHGSDGRREQLLPTDQDNALVWAGAPEQGTEVGELARRMVEQLVAAGFPACPGGYMATYWHQPLGAWEARFRGWIEAPRPEDVVDLCSLLDLRKVAGPLDLAPLEELRRSAGKSRHLLRLLAENAAAWPLPVGFFGGLREGEEGFDLKRGSLLIVAIARLTALEVGSDARSTLERLAAAEPVLGGDAATLAEAFRYLATLRLEHALRPPAPGGHGHRLHLEELNAMERRFLKDIFGFLRSLAAGLAQRFAL